MVMTPLYSINAFYGYFAGCNEAAAEELVKLMRKETTENTKPAVKPTGMIYRHGNRHTPYAWYATTWLRSPKPLIILLMWTGNYDLFIYVYLVCSCAMLFE